MHCDLFYQFLTSATSGGRHQELASMFDPDVLDPDSDGKSKIMKKKIMRWDPKKHKFVKVITPIVFD